MLTRLFILALLLPTAAFASSSGRNGAVSADYVAILENRIQMLEEQLRVMTNQIEQANYKAQQAQDRLARVEEDMNTRFRMIEGGGGGVAATGSEAPEPPATAGALAAQGAAARANPDAQRLGSLTESGEDLPDDPNVAYDQAFQKIRAGDYEAAESALKAFLQKWPTSELASNASYWLGETYYVRGDYSPAAKAFAQGYQTYPKGAKAEDTLLKLGLTLGAMKREKDACMTFDQLSKEFPRLSSTNKRRVEQERDQLGCKAAVAESKPTKRTATR